MTTGSLWATPGSLLITVWSVICDGDQRLIAYSTITSSLIMTELTRGVRVIMSAISCKKMLMSLIPGMVVISTCTKKEKVSGVSPSGYVFTSSRSPSTSARWQWMHQSSVREPLIDLQRVALSGHKLLAKSSGLSSLFSCQRTRSPEGTR